VSSSRPTVLLVDDCHRFLCAARELLTQRGYDVRGEADCAAAARVAILSGAPDLALIDVRLGAESGFELARELTRANPSMCVLLMSSSADLGDPARVQASGASGFLAKEQLGTVDLGH
jgi:DNA-binding NarL/FixJ family response regulator